MFGSQFKRFVFIGICLLSCGFTEDEFVFKEFLKETKLKNFVMWSEDCKYIDREAKKIPQFKKNIFWLPCNTIIPTHDISWGQLSHDVRLQPRWLAFDPDRKLKEHIIHKKGGIIFVFDCARFLQRTKNVTVFNTKLINTKLMHFIKNYKHGEFVLIVKSIDLLERYYEYIKQPQLSYLIEDVFSALEDVFKGYSVEWKMTPDLGEFYLVRKLPSSE